MKTRFMIENPAEIEATLKVTMTIKKCTELRDQLADTYPSWELSAAITDLLGQARKVFYPKESASDPIETLARQLYEAEPKPPGPPDPPFGSPHFPKSEAEKYRAMARDQLSVCDTGETDD